MGSARQVCLRVAGSIPGETDKDGSGTRRFLCRSGRSAAGAADGMRANTKGTTGRSEGLARRWLAFYVALAVVEIVALGFTIQLYRQLGSDYVASVHEATIWAERVARFGRIEALGNEILFSTRAKLRPAGALDGGRLEAGVGRFGQQLERARKELEEAPRTAGLHALASDLESASALMKKFGADAWVVATYLKQGLAAQAAQSTYALNQTAASVREVLQRLTASARAGQKEFLLDQGRAAAAGWAAGWFLVLVAGVLLVSVVVHSIQLFRHARRAVDAADAGVRSKSAFLSRMGYAIRTPMNSIIGLTEVVLDTRLTTEQRASLETVRTSAEELLWSLTNVLDYAKAQAGRLSLEKAPLDVRACIHDVARTMGRRASAKGVELVWNVDAEVPHSLIGDAKRLQQVIGNLVENAITYTDAGEVVVKARSKVGDGDEYVLSFDVSDTGAGIPEEKRRGLFEAFHHEARAAGSSEGVGIGLAIAAELVSRMGGKIDVRSEIGRGTTFRFSARFDVDPDAVQREKVESASELRGLRVLVVDDNSTGRQILCGMLRGARAVPAAAPGAEEAIAMLRTANEAGRPYSVALVDVEMPRVGGIELADQIQADPSLASTTLVALGVTGESDEAQTCREVGMDGYLPKPIRATDLIDELRAVVAARGEVDHRGPHSSGHRRLRVLLADDNRVDRRLGVRLLEKRGHEVVAVENGDEAVDRCAREPFDLVLMDVQMPQLDGLEATRVIRERERRTGRHVPIIALTAHDMKGRCAEVGMDDYVTKPVDAFEVNEVITRHVATQESHMEDSQMETAGTRPMDEEAALERAGGEHSLLVELAHMCLADTPAALDNIRGAVADGDAKGVQRAAHKLKGSLLVLAADPASEAAYRLETIGAEGSLDAAATALAALEREIERLQPELARLAESVPLD